MHGETVAQRVYRDRFRDARQYRGALQPALQTPFKEMVASLNTAALHVAACFPPRTRGQQLVTQCRGRHHDYPFFVLHMPTPTPDAPSLGLPAGGPGTGLRVRLRGATLQLYLRVTQWLAGELAHPDIAAAALPPASNAPSGIASRSS